MALNSGRVANAYVDVALAFFMLLPSLALFKVWPLPNGITSGGAMFSVGLMFGGALFIRRNTAFYLNLPVFFFLGLIALLAASISSNTYSFEAAWRWYLIAFIISIMALISFGDLQAANREVIHQKVGYWLWVGCFAYGVMSLLKYYGLLSQLVTFAEPSSGRLSGVWAQSNLSSLMCWLGLLSGAVVFGRGGSRTWWYLSILLFGWVLACAASRMSWLMGAGLLLLVWVSNSSRYRVSDTATAGLALFWGVISVFFLIWLVPYANQLIREALISLNILNQGDSVALAGRNIFGHNVRLTELSKLAHAGDVFSWSQWLFGLGPGRYPAFSYAMDMSIPPEGLVSGTWLHSHNLFTMIFAEFGVSGLIVLAVFVFCVFYAALSQSMDLPRFLSIGGIGLLFIHSNLEYPLWNLWFLVLFCVLLIGVFESKAYDVDSKWLKPVVGFVGFTMVVMLLVNVGYQYIRIAGVAINPERNRSDYQDLAFLANDSLMGPYAVLRKYHDFAPEVANVDWQLMEARRMKEWQPRDLVVLREFSLLVMKDSAAEACSVAEELAYRYPYSAPIVLDHGRLAGTLTSSEMDDISICVERGLASRGLSIDDVQEMNSAMMSGQNR